MPDCRHPSIECLVRQTRGSNLVQRVRVRNTDGLARGGTQYHMNSIFPTDFSVISAQNDARSGRRGMYNVFSSQWSVTSVQDLCLACHTSVFPASADLWSRLLARGEADYGNGY